MSQALRGLEALDHRQQLWRPSALYGFAHIPEHDAAYFARLRAPELESLLGRADAEARSGKSAAAFAARGRLLRLCGDASGAARDLRRALDLEPGRQDAAAWLAELDLGAASAADALAPGAAAGFAPALLYRGAALLLAGRPEEALSDFARLRRLEPRAPLARLMLGAALEKLGRRAEAAAAYRAAAGLAPQCAAAFLSWSRAETDARAAVRACELAMEAEPDYAHLALFQYEPGRSWPAYLEGLRAFAFGDRRASAVCARYLEDDERFSPYHFEAVERAKSLARLHPRSAWAHALLGRAVSRCPPAPGRDDAALASLDRAVALAPGRGWPRAWRALALLGRDRRRALADLDACVASQPYYYRARAWRGALLRRMGRAAEGLPDLDRAVSVDERYPFSTHERSLARRAAGDFVGAALDLDRAFRLDFRYTWAFSAGREPSAAELDAAAAELDRAVLRHPRSPSLRCWRGRLRLQRGDRTGALTDLLGAARLFPQHAQAHAFAGLALLECGRPEQAAAALEKAAALEPRTWVYAGWLAEAEFRAGRRGAAMTRLSRLLRERPTAWWAFDLLARLELERGRPKEAAAAAERALALEGRHAEGHYLLAQARLELGRHEQALASVDRALTISPHLGRAYLLRARVQEALGRAQSAVADYRAVYERFPFLFNAEQKAAVGRLLSA